MKLLVIGNSALSQSESNGRVNRTLLSAFADEEIYNFALRGIPDIPNIHYAMVGDGAALKSALTFGIKKPNIVPTAYPQGSFVAQNPKSKSAFNHYLREMVWRTGFWKRGEAKKWLADTRFDAVFLIAGDAGFLYRLACEVGRKQGIPVFVYSTEDYFLKRYDYMARKEKPGFWAKRFLSLLRKDASVCFHQAKRSFLCCEKLKSSIQKAFGVDNLEVVYQPSLLIPRVAFPSRPIQNIVYGGNINVSRLPSLKEIGNALFQIDERLALDLYGHCPEELLPELTCAGLRYRGLIPYEELLQVYKDSDLLVHAEGFDAYTRLDYAHGFSTKIGDCYRSGVPFFLYGPKDIPCIQFGMEVSPNFTASDPSELKNKLADILSGKVEYHVDENRVAECFDASKVSHHLRETIES
ncbi:MAG: hypothetical protein K6E59_04545 [Bacilli bacterium]|nr:hypothetical protein [Bacilli bacterium]